MNASRTRREFLRLVGASAGAAAVLSGKALAAPAGKPSFAKASEGKLNVLFIAVDDLRPQMGCYGKKHILSPNMDALARGGLLFERAYCQQAVCAPSRASLLSGLRPNSSKVHDLNTPLASVRPDIVTMPQHFRKHGYTTISIGKIYHHATADDPAGWSKPPWRGRGNWVGRGYLSEKGKAVARREIERVSGIRDAAIDKARGPSERKRIARRYKLGVGLPVDCADVPDNAYGDGMNADKAIEELRRLKGPSTGLGAGGAFFLAVGFFKPHLPFNAPKKYWDMYRRDRISLADNPFLPKGAPKMAASNWGELRKYVGMPRQGPMPDKQARELVHGYYACVSYVDAQIGRVLAELDRSGLADTTVVILWGDHGWKLGDHGEWCKHTNWEIDTRVPMIVRAPGFAEGLRTRALSEFVDIYPSLCELCGLPLPKHLEGTSFVPLMKDPDRAWKTAAFSQYPRGGAMGYAIRTERFRFIRWQDRKTGKVVATELYDHEKDPDENVSIAGAGDNAELVRKLSAKLDAGWKAARPPKPGSTSSL